MFKTRHEMKDNIKSFFFNILNDVITSILLKTLVFIITKNHLAIYSVEYKADIVCFIQHDVLICV